MRRSCAVVALLVLLGPWLCRAEELPQPATPAGLLSFGDALLSAGDSFRAATEYLRVLHHFPAAAEVVPALRGLGRAYAQAGRWDEASEAFRRLGVEQPGQEARLLLGASLYRGKHYEEAARALLDSGSGEAGVKLGALAALRGGLSAALPSGAGQELAAEYAGLPKKSPALAGTLSAVLPGAGHLYCDRPRDALVSFLLNGAFIWGTVEAASRDQWAVAGILGFFELTWYSGNIVSSINAAHKWNRREESRFFQKHEAGALPSLSFFSLPSGLGLRLASTW